MTAGRPLPWSASGGRLINVASLSRHHAWKTTLPMSRLLTFTEGDELRVQCYLHVGLRAPGVVCPAGGLSGLGKPFR